MQQKLNESLTFQRGNLLRKIGEFTDATSWLKNVIENTNACAAYQTYFLGAYAVLSDMLVHLKFRHSESERGLQLSLNCSGGESQVEVRLGSHSGNSQDQYTTVTVLFVAGHLSFSQDLLS